jgi:hypothetical protein
MSNYVDGESLIGMGNGLEIAKLPCPQQNI